MYSGLVEFGLNPRKMAYRLGSRQTLSCQNVCYDRLFAHVRRTISLSASVTNLKYGTHKPPYLHIMWSPRTECMLPGRYASQAGFCRQRYCESGFFLYECQEPKLIEFSCERRVCVCMCVFIYMNVCIYIFINK